MNLYNTYRDTFKNEHFPLAYVDMDLLDENINSILNKVSRGTIRIASKSIRTPKIIEYIFCKSDRFKGIMSFTMDETLFLIDSGFDDILLGYPSVDKTDITKIAQKVSEGKTITLMVDLVEHISLINQIGKELNVQIPICIDIDCSTDFGPLHFGVWRSSINSNEKLQVLLTTIKESKFVILDAMMGYEAQIAGVGDAVKGDFKNSIIKFLKKKSIKQIKKRRQAAVKLIKSNGFSLSFINGGGTGSITETLEEDYITEVTVGSGFFSPGLFDNYSTFKFEPAAGYAIQIVRNPKNNYFTCLGGGYIASGDISALKAPKIHLPKGATFDSNEGFGEVQTPIIYSGPISLALGDPIFLRHAKAGELCERFNFLYLLRNKEIIEKVVTYRGFNYAFL